MKYIIRNKTTGLGVAEYEGELVPPYKIDPAYAGDQFTTYDEEGNEAVLANDFKVWTILEFKRRLTQSERVVIRTAAKQNAALEDFMDMLDSATEVRSDDPDVIVGLQTLEAAGLLAAGRANEIIGA